jgi:hypothetical protein
MGAAGEIGAYGSEVGLLLEPFCGKGKARGVMWRSVLRCVNTALPEGSRYG